MAYYNSKKRTYGSYKRGLKAGQRKANYSQKWGRIRRGTQKGIEMFGATQKEANPAQLEERKYFGVRGRGAYFDDFGKNSSWANNSKFSLFDFSGSDLSNKQMTGRGNYVVNDNINGKPNMDEKAIIVTNSEYLQDVISTGLGFQSIFASPINPGLAAVFPWLSQVAQFYEEYEFVQMFVEFRSMVTEGNATAAGNVIIASNSNPTAPLFLTKQAMENYNSAKSCKVTNSLMFGVECDPSKQADDGRNYVRTFAVPTGQDPKTFDMSKIQVALQGCPATVNLGEIWVHYVVKLAIPKMVEPLGNSYYAYVQSLSNSSITTYPIGAVNGSVGSALQPLLNLPGAVDNIGITFVQQSSKLDIIFPPTTVGTRFKVSLLYTKAAIGENLYTASGTAVVGAPSSSTTAGTTPANTNDYSSYICRSVSYAPMTLTLTASAGVLISGSILSITQVNPGTLW